VDVDEDVDEDYSNENRDKFDGKNENVNIDMIKINKKVVINTLDSIVALKGNSEVQET